MCIITLNEEENLQCCLESLPPGCEVIVVDSGSSDDTIKIATNWQAKIFTRTFDHYAAQKNFAIEQATRNFVLILDADERLGHAARRHLEQIVSTDHKAVYTCVRQLVFLGKKLRFGKNKDSVKRLFPRGMCRFEGDVHEKLVAQEHLSQRKLSGIILHESYKDLEDYFNRLNRYTSLVAQKNFRRNKRAPSGSLMMLRFDWEFFKRYLLLGGFLDGFRGYLYATLSSVYVLVKFAKLKELEKRL